MAGLAMFAYSSRPGAAPDFIYPWTAARLLVSGTNPYAALPGGFPAPLQAPLLYPLPTVLIAIPFSWFTLPVAVGSFVALSVSLLAFAVTRRDWSSLILFAGAPLLMAVTLGQWSPLLVAAVLIPIGGFLALTKPNVGLALTVFRPTWVGIAGCAAFLAASLIVLPTWPRDWLHNLALDRQSGTHIAPITTPLGLLLLLSLLRWRRAEARLLLAMACVPQLLFFYDQLPLMLVPASRRERYLLIIASDLALFVWLMTGHDSAAGPRIAQWCVMASMYLPCLIMILRRPNEGSVPAWVDRGAARMSMALSRFPLIQRALDAISSLMQYGSGKISLRRPRPGAS
jgi:hypothetical protein